MPVSSTREDNPFDPMTRLHATHGSFGNEAEPHAFFASGQGLRAAVVMAGAALFFVLGRLIP
ncbi:MAG: hypothetical protein ACREHF_10610 [Rhizomicrobium sp.]